MAAATAGRRSSTIQQKLKNPQDSTNASCGTGRASVADQDRECRKVQRDGMPNADARRVAAGQSRHRKDGIGQ